MGTDFSGAKHAIELCAHLKCWKMFAATAEIEGMVALKERMRESATESMKNMDDERKEVIQQALAEWDHPDFLLYLKAKVSGYFGDHTPSQVVPKTTGDSAMKVPDHGVYVDAAGNECLVVANTYYNLGNNVWATVLPDSLTYSRPFTEFERLLLTKTFNLSNLSAQRAAV